MKKSIVNILIFSSVIILCGVSYLLYKGANKYVVKSQDTVKITMEDAKIYYYNTIDDNTKLKNNLFLDLNANMVNFSDDWSYLMANGAVSGNVFLEKNNSIKFKCGTISFDNSTKLINVENNIDLILSDKSLIKTKSGVIDLKNMNVKSDGDISFTNKYGHATAKNAYADLIKKELVLKSVNLNLDLDTIK